MEEQLSLDTVEFTGDKHVDTEGDGAGGDSHRTTLGSVSGIRSGIESMHLSRRPFAVLGSNKRSAINYLKFDYGHGRSVELIGSAKHGLPDSWDELVLLALQQIAWEQGRLSSRRVYFTRAEILRRICPSEKSKNSEKYARIELALDRLKTLSIDAKGLFNVKGSDGTFTPVTKKFGLISSVQITSRASDDGVEQATYIEWTEEFYQSMAEDRYIKYLDTGLVIRFKLDITRRLYRLLDKDNYSRRRTIPLKYNLFDLCYGHIGIKKGAKDYVSTLKQKLEGAHIELQACGYLTGVVYQGEGRETCVTYRCSEAAKED